MRDGTCKTDARALLQNLRKFTIVNATDAAAAPRHQRQNQDRIMPTATAQQTLELHTGQFVESLAGAPPVYT